nr:PREDICTED: uncharacterized protein LOC109038950 isoform X1 [Bemisia tabaci]
MSVRKGFCWVVLCLGVVAAQGFPSAPQSNSVWSGTPMDAVVEDLRLECARENDGVSCIKFKVLGLLDQALRKDSFKVGDDIKIVKNSGSDSTSETESRGFSDQIESYIQNHDVEVQVPGSLFKGTVLTFSPRNLDKDELNLSVKLPSEENSALGTDRGIIKRRKSKLKKILIPILVFILLKALTLIPLAIGVLGLKAWNALQLSFFSFVVSVALAIFQLCKKIAADNAIPQLTAHPWADHYAAARNLFLTPEELEQPLTAADASSPDAQDLAFNAYNALSRRR